MMSSTTSQFLLSPLRIGAYNGPKLWYNLVKILLVIFMRWSPRRVATCYFQ